MGILEGVLEEPGYSKVGNFGGFASTSVKKKLRFCLEDPPKAFGARPVYTADACL